MSLQHVLNTAAKYPWRYGYGSYKNCPMRKLCEAASPSVAARKLDVPVEHIFAATQWWDSIFQKDRDGHLLARDMLKVYGYNIPAAAQTIRLRKKTKRVHARKYLQMKRLWSELY